MKLLETTREGIYGQTYLTFMHPMSGVHYMIQAYTKISSLSGKRVMKDTISIHRM